MMKAVRYNFDKTPGALELADVEKPIVGPNDILLRVVYSGICGSDIARYRQLASSPEALSNQLGRISPTIGHEFSGVIDQIGKNIPEKWEDDTPVIGSRVVVHPILGCEECESCQSGYWSACQTPGKMQLLGLHKDGGMANWVSVPFNHVVKIDNDKLPLETATLAEPLAVAIRAIDRLIIDNINSPVAVLGDGSIGIISAHYLKQQGFENVLLVGRHQNRLDIAKEMGMDNISFSRDINPSDYNQYPYVIQLAGSQEALETGIHLLKRSGTMVCLGYLHQGDPGLSPDLFFQIIHKEKTIKGSHSYSFAEFKRALHLISSEKLQLAPLISTIIPLEDIILKGFEPLVSQDKPSGKVLIKL